MARVAHTCNDVYHVGRQSQVPHSRSATMSQQHHLRCTGRAYPSQRAYPPLRSRTALRWSLPILDLLGVGYRSCTTVCRASPRHELRLRYLVSFRDVRHLSLSHSVYDLNSLRDLLDVRHSFLYCSFSSLNCTCRLDSLLALSAAPLECSPDELPEPESESEASPLFAVLLGLPELVRMIIVTLTSFSVNCTSGIFAVV